MNQKVTQVIVVPAKDFREHQGTERMSLFNEDGSPLGPVSDTGETLLMTGYEPSLSDHPDNVGPEDTANAAVAKLESRIADLEASILQLQTPPAPEKSGTKS
jgi:hypothetical protein